MPKEANIHRFKAVSRTLSGLYLSAVSKDWAFICTAIAAYVISFVVPDASGVVCFVAGWIGVPYILHQVRIWVFSPIERDQMVAKGHLLARAAAFGLFIPLVLALGFQRGTWNEPELPVAEWVASEGVSGIADNGERPHPLWVIYYYFVEGDNQHMAVTGTSRAWAALITALGVVFLNGLLISTLVGWFGKRKDMWQNGEVRYRPRHLGRGRYALVIGAGDIVSSVIRTLLSPRTDEINFKCEGDNRYVVLMTSRDVRQVRDMLASDLPADMIDKVVIYKGLRNSAEEIALLCPEHTTEIYVLGEPVSDDSEESTHDALNMECVNLLAAELGKCGKKVRKVCKVMFENHTTSWTFQFVDVSKVVRKHLAFIPFNRFDFWSRKVISEGMCNVGSDESRSITYTPLDGDGFDRNSTKFVHLIVIGMTRMGFAIGTQAMLHAHYMNCGKRRTRISFIDASADEKMDNMKSSYSNLFALTRHRFIDAAVDADPEWTDPMAAEDCPWKHLSADGRNFIDIELEFVKGRTESAGVRDFLVRSTGEQDALVTVAICTNQSNTALAESLYMPVEVYEKAQEIWVYQKESADVVLNIVNARNDEKNKPNIRYRKIKPFGMLQGEYIGSRALYLKAVLSNYAYDVIKEKKPWPVKLSSREDESYRAARESWDALDSGRQWSNRYYADSIYLKIRSAAKDYVESHVGAAEAEEVRELAASEQDIQRRLQDASKGARMLEAVRTLVRDNELLARSEHNRWILQQLMLGYYPCRREAFAALRATEDGTAFREMKDELKQNEWRMHPNICDFDLLVEEDRKNDLEMNNAIHDIIRLVDARH